ncbi:MAG: CHAD domain-containing protein [Rhizobacter sp.]
MSELELKFCVPPEALPSLREALIAHGATVLPLKATYYDTADGALARRLMALRLRQEGERLVQTFKASGNSPVHRLEHEVWVVPGEGRPAIDVSRHNGHRAGSLLREALGDKPALVAQQGSDIERLVCTVTDASGCTIEIALDVGHVSAGRRKAPIAEVELEHKDGPLGGLFTLAADWVAHGGLWLSTITKAARGHRLQSAQAPAAVRASQIDLDAEPDLDSDAFVRAALRATLAQVLPNASEIAEGSTDADVVHQLRIGLRRLRTALRELAPLSGHIDPDWQAALGEAFARLGEQRDRDAVLEAVQHLLAAAGIEAPRAPSSTHIDLAAALHATAFQRALLGTLALVHADGPGQPMLKERATLAVVARRLDRLHRRVRRDGPRFHELPLDGQHRVRKQLKRLRYLAEFAAPLWKPKEAADYLDRLKSAQDELGHHNDVAVAVSIYRQHADDPAQQRAADHLQAHLGKTGRSARDALKKIRNRHRFWPKARD